MKAFLRSPSFKISAALMLIAAIAGGVVFMHYYNIYSTIIDRRLSGDVFKDTAKIYATPYIVYKGQQIDPNDVIGRSPKTRSISSFPAIPVPASSCRPTSFRTSVSISSEAA